MDSARVGPFALEANGIEVDGLSVSVERGLLAASLRYFDGAGSFAAAVCGAIGRPLPECLRVIRVEEATNTAQFVVAWRSPTETLLLCRSRIAFAELEQRLAALADGCMVDQTGGVSVIRVRGPRACDLLLRLGASTAIPGLGEALSGRMAEVQVLTACIHEGEFLLLVERAYARHLLEWIGATASDF
jgi:heterotetrameric sarcosine oxidase gamma subunit